ncbi:MAG: hypothetical protein R3B84_04240 [Zavarzinella sp.]
MAKRISRRTWLLGSICAFSAFGCGANPFLLPELLLGGRQSQIPAKFPIAPDDDDLPPTKAYVLVANRVTIDPELAPVEGLLNGELIDVLTARYTANKDRVQVKYKSKIEEFKRQNPGWKTMDMYALGKKENSDIVIYVEIESFNLYVPNSQKNLLKGEIYASIFAYDMRKDQHEPVYKANYKKQYPEGREILAESPGEVSKFRSDFIHKIATEISTHFADSSSDAIRQID